jgi:hypothetical protein
MEMTATQSSAINAIGIDGNDLFIEYRNGLYVYYGAAIEYDILLNSDSKGKLINDIKWTYSCKRIE